ncbi:hypothetical protein MNBD_GAMMA22-2041 [hydrothermal vent metagenome]|uniref:Response regulatory domain-containing protein n=1 Tax=hydrothermal vent metagenome TaxID=652676 RepID=A0A3B1ACB5_9ZZZZ
MIGQKILVVDDQQINRDIIGKIMSDCYQLNFACTGEECIEISESWEPDVILMDINMPGMGGLAACKKIKELPGSGSLSVIFLSSMTEVDERLAGYEAGGDDYIAKPFNHDELVAKVKLALDNKTKIDGFKQTSNDAMSMAMTAMSQASDIGKILRFYQDSFAIDSLEELAFLLSETITSFGVNIISYFEINGESFYFSSSGVVKPLEQSAIENLRDKGRIYSFSKRTTFNYGAVSVLVVDMPIDDEIKYGELKDNIAIVVEGAQARVKALEVQFTREQKQKENIKIIKATKASLIALDEHQKESSRSHQELISSFISDVQDSFSRLGLTEAQENELMATMNIVKTESNKLFENDIAVREKIDAIMNALGK